MTDQRSEKTMTELREAIAAAARADQRAVAVQELRWVHFWLVGERARVKDDNSDVQNAYRNACQYADDFVRGRIAALTAPAADPAKSEPVSVDKAGVNLRGVRDAMDQVRRDHAAFRHDGSAIHDLRNLVLALCRALEGG